LATSDSPSKRLFDSQASIALVPSAVDTTLSSSHGAGSWVTGGGITQQEARDAMKLAPSVGAPASGSIDEAISEIASDTSLIAGIDADVATIISSQSTINGKVDIIDTNVDSIVTDVGTIENKVDVIDSNVDALILSVADCLRADDSVDGNTIGHIFELMMGMANGRFKRDFPNIGDITFYKRDNATVLTVVNNSDTERTRVS